MALAIESVQSNKNSIHEASMEYGVYRSTLARHVQASTSKGISLPSIPTGRPFYFSDEIIALEKIKARNNDDRLRSRYSDQWLQYFYDLQKQNYVGGPGIKPLQLMSAKTANRYRNIIAPEQASTYDENESRAIALEEVCYKIFIVI